MANWNNKGEVGGFLKNILWDTVDGQHIAYACKALAKDDVKKRKLDT